MTFDDLPPTAISVTFSLLYVSGLLSTFMISRIFHDRGNTDYNLSEQNPNKVKSISINLESKSWVNNLSDKLEL